MIKYLILATALTSCATVEQKQATCESSYKEFSEVVSCTKKSMAQDIRMKSSSEGKLYILRGEQLAEKVKLGQMTELDARAEWQSLYVQLKANETQETNRAIQTYNSLRTKTTNCTAYGNTATCTSN